MSGFADTIAARAKGGLLGQHLVDAVRRGGDPRDVALKYLPGEQRSPFFEALVAELLKAIAR